MAEQADVATNAGQGGEVTETPASESSTENKNGQNGTETQAQAAGSNAETQVPFNQNPAIMDFINRQVSKGVQEGLRSAGVIKDTTVREDSYDAYEQQMVEEGVEPKVAKKIVKIFSEIAEKKMNKIVQPIRENVTVMGIKERIVDFARVTPDFNSVHPKMLELYKNLTDEERVFIDSSPNGISFLYSKAKLTLPVTSQTNTQTQTTRTVTNAGGSGASRSASKTSANGSDWASKAQEALDKGDKEGYRTAVLALQGK